MWEVAISWVNTAMVQGSARKPAVGLLWFEFQQKFLIIRVLRSVDGNFGTVAAFRTCRVLRNPFENIIRKISYHSML
jgi:hypothetical protein